ncbi:MULTISPECIES: archease [Legionella]|uniref:Archease n=1 Tax=Legionella resiliens TaxID=2905958 RepID=A0ABS8X5D3_9GAMM|nr:MULTISPECIES: archease [unclassified Legionella]MCE0722911.1 archease [Legionella sp. 9fVS26]MCE3532064.1 archease [Legionella sp. 8cVS16]QLZ68190.1 archease [Legionella sp. PC1000]
MIAQKKWEHFSHESDIGVRGCGSTIAEAFAMGALALTNVITSSELIQPHKTLRITCEAPNQEILFVDWLNAIIYNMAIHNMLFSQFDVSIKRQKLTAIIAGELVDINRHQPAVEVKGATFTELKVYQSDGTWVAQCVVDV